MTDNPRVPIQGDDDYPIYEAGIREGRRTMKRDVLTKLQNAYMADAIDMTSTEAKAITTVARNLTMTISAESFEEHPIPVVLDEKEAMAFLVRMERSRQPGKGWTDEHDDIEPSGHFFDLAADYYRQGDYIKALAMLDALWAKHDRANG